MKVKRPFVDVTILAILFAVSAAAVPGQNRREREQARKLQDAGDKAFAQKDFRLAADAYGRSVALVANNAYARYRKGYAHFNLKEYDAAINEFTTALSQGFKPLEIYRIRSFIYYDQKNYDAALGDIQKGLALAPNDLLFMKGLGDVQIARGDHREAIAALKRAQQAAPDDADIHYNLSRAYFALGDAGQQQAAAEAALKKGTRFPGETFYLLADARQKLRDVPGAIDAYQRAIAVKPDVLLAYRNLSELYRSENRFEDAIRVSKAGVKQFGSEGNLFTDLSWYYSLAGRHEDAVQAAKAGIQFLPNQYTAYTNLCRAYNDLKNYEEAIRACNSALRLKPDDGETYYYLGNAYVSTRRNTDATRMYTKAVAGLIEYTRQNPDYSDGWYLLGNAYFADKQLDKAVQAYLKCLELSPKFVRARTNLGIVYTRLKNKAAAMEQYQIIQSTDPKLAAILKSEIDAMR